MLNQSKLVLASVGLFALATGLQTDEATAATVAYNFTAEVVSGAENKPTINNGDLIVGGFLAAILASFIGPGLDREIITCSP